MVAEDRMASAAEWHTLEADNVLHELKSSGSGLSNVGAAEQLDALRCQPSA